MIDSGSRRAYYAGLAVMAGAVALFSYRALSEDLGVAMRILSALAAVVLAVVVVVSFRLVRLMPAYGAPDGHSLTFGERAGVIAACALIVLAATFDDVGDDTAALVFATPLVVAAPFYVRRLLRSARKHEQRLRSDQ